MSSFAPILPQISLIPKTLPPLSCNPRINPPHFTKTLFHHRHTNPRRFVVFAEVGNNGSNGKEDLKRDQPPTFNPKWRDLLDPDPENLLTVGLTGLLAWASVQVLWQLFFISVAILVAALKYSFIAALLLFILITLL
ncbi:hypothetical protein GIB67_023200 [Kingdonia uniflora]|uniref:Transmembrane protein n=1 Tax=Kingdonia uniflora TaxID=39325 RepID=A0A7J7MC80_9MAGN|nr:hypothetical protein GIB67_023200 [Kingdonia uniflora]